ncbi:MAG: hypothetical protein GY719_10105, partial [bacterium]|nr:hypothetical protein [bacterium]
MKIRIGLTLVTALAFAGCAADDRDGSEPPAEEGAEAAADLAQLDTVAEGYVRLVLAVGQHDADYVDAYYGPEEWKDEAAAKPATLEALGERAAGLIAELGSGAPAGAEEIVALRWHYLKRQLEALAARVGMLGGESRTFDEEALALYDARPPTLGEETFQKTLDELDALLAGEGYDDGALIERYEAFRGEFVIPPAKLDEVFRQAIDACRERTEVHMELPEGESFRVEYVTD